MLNNMAFFVHFNEITLKKGIIVINVEYISKMIKNKEGYYAYCFQSIEKLR